MVATVASLGTFSSDSLSEHRGGARLAQRLYALLYALSSWRQHETLRPADLLQPLARAVRAAHFLLLAAGYDACFGVAAAADGAAIEAGCAGRDGAYRLLTLGRGFGLDASAPAFVWLVVAMLACFILALVALYLPEVPGPSLLRVHRILRALISLGPPVFLVPALLDTIPFLSCRPDRPDTFPCFVRAPTAAGVAAIIAALWTVLVFAAVGGARLDMRRQSPDPAAQHSAAPEALLPVAAAALVCAQQFLSTQPTARAALQLAASAGLVAGPALYVLPYHHPVANLLNAAWASALPTVYVASIALRGKYGETVGGAAPAEGVGALVAAGLVGAAAGAALCALRYLLVARAYAASLAAGTDAPAFARPADAVICARLMESLAARGPRRRVQDSSSGADESVESVATSERRRGSAVDVVIVSAISWRAAGRVSVFANASEERVEEVYIRAVRSLPGSPRVLLAAAAWALFSDNYPLCHQYIRRVRETGASLSLEERFCAYALDRFRKEEAESRGEETADMHAALAQARLHERRARIRMRAFWNLLLRGDLEVEKLPGAVALIEASKSAASALYKRIEGRFPTSARAARARAAFVQEFELDLELAGHLLAKAQNIEELQARATAAHPRASGAALPSRRNITIAKRRSTASVAPGAETGAAPANGSRLPTLGGTELDVHVAASYTHPPSRQPPSPQPPRTSVRSLTRAALAEFEESGGYAERAPVERAPKGGAVAGAGVASVPSRRGSVASGAALDEAPPESQLSPRAKRRGFSSLTREAKSSDDEARPRPAVNANWSHEPRRSVRMAAMGLNPDQPWPAVGGSKAPQAHRSLALAAAGSGGPLEQEMTEAREAAKAAMASRRGSALSVRSASHMQDFRALLSGAPSPIPQGRSGISRSVFANGASTVAMSPRDSPSPTSGFEEPIKKAEGAEAGPEPPPAAAAAPDAATTHQDDEGAMAELMARRFYRQQLTAKSGRVAGRVGLSLNAAVVLCAVFLSAFYGSARMLGKNSELYITNVAAATEFPEYVSQLALQARGVLFSVSFSSFKYDAKTLLQQWLAEGNFLFSKRDMLSSKFETLSTSAALSAWGDSWVKISQFKANADPPQWTEQQHPQDALATFIRRNALAWEAAAASFAPSLLPPNPSVRSALEPGAYANTSAYRYLVDNIVALRDAGRGLRTAMLEDTSTYMQQVPTTMGVVFGGLFGALIAVALVSFALATRAVARERRGALLLFHELPRATVKQIRNGISESIASNVADGGERRAVEAEAAPAQSSSLRPLKSSMVSQAAPTAAAAGPGFRLEVEGQATGSPRVPAAADAASEAPQSTAIGASLGMAGGMAAEEALSVDFIEAEFMRKVQMGGRARATERLIVRSSIVLGVVLLFPIGMFVAIQLLFKANRGAILPTSTIAQLRSIHAEIGLWCQELVATRLAPSLALAPTADIAALLQNAIHRFEQNMDSFGDTSSSAMDDVGDSCEDQLQLLVSDGATRVLPGAVADDRPACLSLRQHLVEFALAAKGLALTKEPRWDDGALLFALESVRDGSATEVALDATFADVMRSESLQVARVVLSMDVLYALGIVSMLAFWLVILRPAIRGIAWEHEMTLSMLLMIPPSVIDKIPAVRDYMAAVETHSVSSILDDTRAKTKSILEAASDAIIVCDAEGSINVFNAAAERLLGWTADEALAMSVSAIVGEVLPKARAEGEDREEEPHAEFAAQRDLFAKRKDGATFPSQVSIGVGKAGRRSYYVLFIRDVTERHTAEAALQAEKARVSALLRNILPDPIIDRLKSGTDEIIADDIDEATILFSDLCGFTAMCSAMSPEETVGLLSELFNRFDELLESYGVDKVKTIGDAYMCFTVKGADTMIDFGLDMLEAVQGMNRERGTTLNVRIGIHTGPIVAGVIGTKRLAYDIWGDAVNLASRMESSGVAGRLHISGSTYERVRYKFACEEPREVEVKGKGPMKTYLVKGRQASQKFGSSRARRRRNSQQHLAQADGALVHPRQEMLYAARASPTAALED